MKSFVLLTSIVLIFSLSVFAQPEIIVQSKHNSRVLQSKYSYDGRWIVTGDENGKIILWDAKTKKRVRTFFNLGYPVKALTFHPTKNFLISSSYNKILEWDIYTGKIKRVFKIEHSDYITSLDFSSDGKYIASGSLDESAIVWKYQNAKAISKLKQKMFYNNAIYSVKFSHLGRNLFTAGEDINVNMWDWKKGKLIKKFKHHKYKINNIAINSTNSLIASASNDSKVNIWSINSGKKVACLQLPDAPAQSIAFHPNLDRIIATYYKNFTDSTKLYTQEVVEGRIIMWDINKLKIVWDKKLSGGILDIAITPDGKSFITANSDTNVKIFNISNANLLYVLGIETQINNIVFIPERNEFLTALNNGVIKIWDSKRLKVKGTLETNIPERVVAIDYDYSSGNLVAAIVSTIFIWNYDYNQKKYLFLNTFKIPESIISDIQLSDFSTKIFVKRESSHNKYDIEKLPAYKNGILPEDLMEQIDSIKIEVYSFNGEKIYDYQDISHEEILFANNNSTQRIAYNNTKSNIVECDFNKFLSNKQLLNCPEGAMSNTVVKNLKNSSSKLSSSLGAIKTKQIEPSLSKKALKTEQKRLSKINENFTVGANKYIHISYSTDGNYIAASGYFDYIELIDLKENTTKRIGHFTEPVNYFEFSTDNSMLASISENKGQVWNIKNGALETEIKSENQLKEIHFFEENQKILTYGDEDGMRAWNSQTGEPIATMVSIGKNDFITLSHENYYISSENGSQGVAFFVDETSIPVECFKMKFYRPEIVLERLGFSDQNIINDYASDYNQNLEKFGITQEDFDLSHIPTIEIQNKKEYKWFTYNRNINLDVFATDLSHNLKKINILVNGVPILKPSQTDLSNHNTDSYFQKYTVELNMGKNVIYTYITNDKGIESLKDSLVITLKNRNNTVTKPNLYIIALGTYNFSEENLNSEFNLENTRKLIKVLTKDVSQYNEIIIDTLFDEQALKFQLLKLKRKYRHVSVDDQFIVISSGYSVLKNNFDVYFATYNMNFSDPEKNGIAHSLINGMLSEIPSRNKIIVVDSWQFIHNETAKNLDKQNNKELSEMTINTNDPAKNMRKDIFKEMYNTSGTTVLFTENILRTEEKVNIINNTLSNGYKKKLADINSDGIISSYELNTYLILQNELIEEPEQDKKVAIYKEF